MLREPSPRRLTALLWKVATAAVVLGLVFALSSPIISLAESRWQSSSTRPERASGAVDQINEQEAILKVTNNLHYVQKAGARAGSIRNLTAKGVLRFSGSYPMFPTPSSLPWGALVNNSREPAAVTFDVLSDWETLSMDLTYIAFVSIMQLIPTPTGCMVEPFVKSEQGLVFLIEMSPYFDSVVDNLVAGDTQSATTALVAALNLLLQELPSKLGKVGLSCLGDAIIAATIQALPGIGQAITAAMIAVKITPIILDWIAYPKGPTSIAFAYAPAKPTPTPETPRLVSSVTCGNATFSLDAWNLPAQLTDSEQNATVQLRYRLPAGARVSYLIIGVNTSVTKLTISAGDILAAFPNAKIDKPRTGGGHWAAITHYVTGGGGSPVLVADGQWHTLTVQIRLPTQSKYDAQGATSYGNTGWLWSRFSPPPFALLQPPTVVFAFQSDDGYLTGGHWYETNRYVGVQCIGPPRR